MHNYIEHALLIYHISANNVTRFAVSVTTVNLINNRLFIDNYSQTNRSLVAQRFSNFCIEAVGNIVLFHLTINFSEFKQLCCSRPNVPYHRGSSSRSVGRADKRSVRRGAAQTALSFRISKRPVQKKYFFKAWRSNLFVMLWKIITKTVKHA